MEAVAAEVDALSGDVDAARGPTGPGRALDHDDGATRAGGAVRGPHSRGPRSEN